MSKAVLVMDMPEACSKCKLHCVTPYGEYLCCAVRKNIPCAEIPDWCPLRELPEKNRGDKWQDEISDTYNAGWKRLSGGDRGCQVTT